MVSQKPLFLSIDWNNVSERIKEFFIWIGHKIADFWNVYAVPFLISLGEFLKTGHGVASLGILIGCILLYRAMNCASSRFSCLTYCFLAILCFVGAGVALTHGNAVLL